MNSSLAAIDIPRVRQALAKVTEALLSQRNADGYWEGQLSSSALSTATAVSAISVVCQQTIAAAPSDAAPQDCRDLVRKGIAALQQSQNADGGFGDTDRSHSNIATSYLVLAASELASQTTGDGLGADRLDRLRAYIQSAGGIPGLRERYGRDKTFVVPILCNLAIAGLVDWKHVAALPFEMAALPQSMYRWLKMPVVSYAIPALVAIGQARHVQHPSRFLPLRWIRAALVGRTLAVLERMQPPSGGYLEATPLTSFVVMSLAATGRAGHPVCQQGMRFLRDSIRADGSWPIDTNLATWVTSLSVLALSQQTDLDPSWSGEPLLSWMLSCQHQTRHPFTGADPGGWGWMDQGGAVPDGDDTPAAILALRAVANESNPQIKRAIDHGREWLLRLQNRDGGMPTFCRGWGKLPFDRSSTDLTAHALRAWQTDANDDPRVRAAIDRGRRFLVRSQQSDGSWLPLWFGNQDRLDEDNPVYGTAKVLMSPAAADLAWQTAMDRGVDYLIDSQNADGGWGGGASVDQQVFPPNVSDQQEIRSTIEETALAVEALLFRRSDDSQPDNPSNPGRSGADSRAKAMDLAIIAGVKFLVVAAENDGFRTPWPIGFYFAKLWYYERLYPLIFTVSALGRFLSTSEIRSNPRNFHEANEVPCR